MEAGTIPKPIDNGTESVSYGPGQHPNARKHHFKPGNKLGGRSKGAKTVFAEDFARDLHADWKENGKQAIVEVRETKPDVYLRVIASILPKQIETAPGDPLEALFGSIQEAVYPTIEHDDDERASD